MIQSNLILLPNNTHRKYFLLEIKTLKPSLLLVNQLKPYFQREEKEMAFSLTRRNALISLLTKYSLLNTLISSDLLIVLLHYTPPTDPPSMLRLEGKSSACLKNSVKCFKANHLQKITLHIR